LGALDEIEGRRKLARGLEERAAFMILARMVQEPARTLLDNAGLAPAPLLDAIRREGSGYGYDLHSSRIVPMLEAGIYDGAAVVEAAVRTAVSAAAQALSTDVILKKKKSQAKS
jgi:chaperonin GroEL (HSP60 family)